jgi:alkanesulfonate monooxygenase SsuD/methylene tetrahydromethanopterin reductase-like flavin-dependent oxidoreductase (luciferase family)
MRMGIVISTGDPRAAADLAARAEAAGWDGVFTWDGVAIPGVECWDPWVTMAGMAMRTQRVRLGAIVTPPSRRRPWKLAREALTLDHLSGGRLVLPVGLGALDDAAFGAVGEPTDARTRAELLDETLAILVGLWSGEPFAFEGRHYRFPAMTFRPAPVQRPRIPIWVVGAWPSERSMTRAARWDGLVPQPLAGGEGSGEWTPSTLAAAVTSVHEHRPADQRDRPFDVIAEGTTPADDPAEADRTVRAWAEAGATWWLEADWRREVTVDDLRQRIAAGPPAVVSRI